MKYLARLSDRYPLHFLLVSGFFVLHCHNEHPAVLTMRILLPLLCKYLIVSILAFAVTLKLLRNELKAALLALTLLSLQFFFQYLHDLLNSVHVLRPVSSFRFFLPLLSFIVLFLFLRLKYGTSGRKKVTRFFNLLLFVLILQESIAAIGKPAAGNPVLVTTLNLPDIPIHTPKPDMYILLFDEYAGSGALERKWNFDNGTFDAAMQTRGFNLINDSRSNYNATIFSMASFFNGSYLHFVRGTGKEEQYQLCMEAINTNQMYRWLSRNGYAFINHSSFEIGNDCLDKDGSYFISWEALATHQTMSSFITRELVPEIIKRTGLECLSVFSNVYKPKEYNQQIVDATIAEAARARTQPKLVYSHFNMPHRPFYMDTSGALRAISNLTCDSDTYAPSAYLNYLVYTNKVILNVVDSIIGRYKDKPVVITVLSDHGFRYPGQEPDFDFTNYIAVRLPTELQQHAPARMTNVNYFRYLTQTVFNLHCHWKNDSLFRVE